MNTDVLPADTPDLLAHAVEEAVARLQAGELVALPTETVYGLAADALNPTAVAKVFEAKERPFFDPLICHLPNREWLERMTRVPEESAVLLARLADDFWPGPLTFVLPRREIVPDLVTSGLETVAVRMTAHPVFRRVAEQLDRPIAAPSANRFGRISPTSAEHAYKELHGRIPLIIDGGATTHGIESTIVAVEGKNLRILRNGPVTQEELSNYAEILERPRGDSPEAPGQMKSHYAPQTAMHLAEGEDFLAVVESYRGRRRAVLAWRSRPAGVEEEPVEILSEEGDLTETAATLFAKLRRLDESGAEIIVVEAVPEKRLGVAIMDRLRKAAARG